MGLAGIQGRPRLFNPADQCVDLAVAARRPATDPQLGIFAEAARQDGISDPADDGFGLARQRSLSNESLALNDHAIDRDGFAGQHPDTVAFSDGVDRNLLFGRADPTCRGEGLAEAAGFRECLFAGSGGQDFARAVDAQEDSHHFIVHRTGSAQAGHQ